jgi:hypothetical protein
VAWSTSTPCAEFHHFPDLPSTASSLALSCSTTVSSISPPQTIDAGKLSLAVSLVDYWLNSIATDSPTVTVTRSHSPTTLSSLAGAGEPQQDTPRTLPRGSGDATPSSSQLQACGAPPPHPSLSPELDSGAPSAHGLCTFTVAGGEPEFAVVPPRPDFENPYGSNLAAADACEDEEAVDADAIEEFAHGCDEGEEEDMRKEVPLPPSWLLVMIVESVPVPRCRHGWTASTNNCGNASQQR